MSERQKSVLLSYKNPLDGQGLDTPTPDQIGAAFAELDKARQHYEECLKRYQALLDKAGVSIQSRKP